MTEIRTDLKEVNIQKLKEMLVIESLNVKDINWSNSLSGFEQKIKSVEANGIDGIDMNTNSLSSYEINFIEKMKIDFYESRKNTKLQLSSFIFDINKNDSKNGSLFQYIKAKLANFIVEPVKRVISFSKLNADFHKLDIEDRLSLIKGGSIEVFICTSSLLYDKTENKFFDKVSREKNILKPSDIDNVTSNNNNNNEVNMILKADLLQTFWGNELFENTINYLKSINDLGIDETTLILYVPLILFSPNRNGLRDKNLVNQIQSKYSFLLKKYIFWRYGSNETSNKLYNTLLLKLIESSTLQEMHKSFLKGVDSSQLEPIAYVLIQD